MVKYKASKTDGTGLIVYYIHTAYIQAVGVDNGTLHFQHVEKCTEDTYYPYFSRFSRGVSSFHSTLSSELSLLLSVGGRNSTLSSKLSLLLSVGGRNSTLSSKLSLLLSVGGRNSTLSSKLSLLLSVGGRNTLAVY
jgi:hypothetical protein